MTIPPTYDLLLMRWHDLGYDSQTKTADNTDRAGVRSTPCMFKKRTWWENQAILSDTTGFRTRYSEVQP